jgi:hypothetical protein
VTARQFLLAILLSGASFTVLWLLLGAERQVPLVAVEEGPRVPVAPDPQTTALVLTGLTDRIKGDGNELRKLRNDLAKRHKEAVELWRAGQLPLRQVERLEQVLWVARQRVGEITETEMHARLAELFERERQRLAILYERGIVGPLSLQLATLYVAREQHLAGLPVKDPMGRDYDTMRREYLEGVRVRHQLHISGGLGHHEQMKLDLLKLAEEFPPVK